MPPPSAITLDYMGGRRASGLTGSIAAGSRLLDLGSRDHGLRVGNRVVVATGGEAAGGVRGTVGVGGSFPEHSFVDMATLIASGSPGWVTESGDPVAFARDSGTARRWDGAAWVAFAADEYYWAAAIPRALVATVDAVNGAVVTLDTEATVTATGASVYVENHSAMRQAITSPSARVEIGAHQYAIDGRVSTISFVHADVQVSGAGKLETELFSPPGCQALGIFAVLDTDDFVLSDMTLTRTWTDDAIYWGFDGFDVFHSYQTVCVTQSADPTLSQLHLIDGIYASAVLDTCTGGGIYDCSSHYTFGAPRYRSWSFQTANCQGSVMERCTTSSPAQHEGLEIFGGNGCEMTDCSTLNGIAAVNTAYSPVIDGLTLVFEAGCGALRRANFAAADPGSALNLNNHFADPDADNYALSDISITQQGALGAAMTFNAGLIVRHDALNPAGDAITIDGATLVTNGHCRAINAFASSPAQALQLDDVSADGVLLLRYASVANTVAPELQYCSDNVTLGAGNTIAVLTDACA